MSGSALLPSYQVYKMSGLGWSTETVMQACLPAQSTGLGDGLLMFAIGPGTKVTLNGAEMDLQLVLMLVTSR